MNDFGTAISSIFFQWIRIQKRKKNNYNKLWILFSVNTSIKNKTILFLIYIIIFNSSSDEALLPCYIQNQNQDEVIHVPSNNAFCFPCLIMYSPACLATTIQNDRKKLLVKYRRISPAIAQQTCTCLKATINSRKMFKINNKDTRTTSFTPFFKCF